MEYAENIVQLSANLIALLLCLFYYISNKRRGWFYAIVFFLCSLLSSYYWTTYLVIMGDSPRSLDWLTYSGWNASFLVLFLLLMHMKTPEERSFFHPLMLLPLPLNVLQLILYLPYGDLLNNIYQVLIGTLIACFSLQGILWYCKNREKGTAMPYGCLAILVFITTEFGMWTFSCLYEPWFNLYYFFSILNSIDYLFLAWAIRRSYSEQQLPASTTFDRKYQRILKLSYLGILLPGSVGGMMLGVWMRNIMTENVDPAAASSVYDVIPVMLFVISLILVIFTIAIVFIVYFGQKASENNALREARRIAEQSNAAKSEFLANISHEIRTPINAVMGMNEIILRESMQARDRLPDDSEKVRGVFSDISGYAGIINTAGRNLLAIISDILDISRIEAGKLEIREGEYRLSSVLNDVCNLIRFRAQSRNLSFLVDVDEQVPDRLYGDEIRIRQIMLNILNNAVKYTVRGEVSLSVSGETKDDGTFRLAFSVRDTGIGIRKEDLDRLFEKFERIRPAEFENVEGTGLGLAIVKSLLDMMGGTIDVDSTYGEESVFSVTIPQKAVSAEPIGDFRERFEASAENGKPSGLFFHAPDAHILIVDDTRMNLTVAEGLIKDTQIRADTALSGAEALRLTQSVPYDLILMDQRMQEMDGTEAMHLIREQEDGRNRQTPVICLTADAIAGARERYLAEGFTDYLAKPIDSQSLIRILMACLPPEKVIPVEAPAEEGASPAAENLFPTLRAAEIDVAQGLAFCQNDEALYRSVLWEYGSAAAEKSERLQLYYASADWKNYAIVVHALKSTSGTIGAARLSEMAARLEHAARRDDPEPIQQEHAQLLSLYNRTADAILSTCTEDAVTPAENDGVIEFMPE
ncbi:MAG: response regulator [Clostridia bacterium]|nr:response regulator [Clostridia bacterium]